MPSRAFPPLTSLIPSAHHARARIIKLQNLARVLAAPGQSSCPILTETDAVYVCGTVDAFNRFYEEFAEAAA